MPRLLPSDDNIVVLEIDEGEEKTPGGIIVPDTLKEKNKAPMGKIVEVGPDVNEGVTTKYAIGDVVIYPRSAPFVFDFGRIGPGPVLMVLKRDDVLAKIDLGGDYASEDTKDSGGEG